MWATALAGRGFTTELLLCCTALLPRPLLSLPVYTARPRMASDQPEIWWLATPTGCDGACEPCAIVSSVHSDCLSTLVKSKNLQPEMSDQYYFMNLILQVLFRLPNQQSTLLGNEPSVCIMSRVPCTRVLSQKIQIFQETSFCVLQVLLRNFTNTLWQLYIDFYTIRMVFESSFQLCIFKVANLKKLWQFWQKYVDRTFVHVKHGTV